MKTIPSTDFESVFNLFIEPGTLFVIPSFQRPYAWEKKQLDDLFRDMEKASRPKGNHYLSAFHLVEIDVPTLSNPQSSDFGGFLDVESNSTLNKLKALALQKSVTTALDQQLNVYAVVDGQQRLTTLYMLAHIYATVCNSKIFPSLYATLRDGTEIPRLIQHPSDDHDFLTKLLEKLRESQPLDNCQPMSQSQKRMRCNAERIRIWADRNREALAFFKSPAFKTSVILLDPRYGLTSFMTLNDRGKPLTVLEKFKPLLMQFAFDAKDHKLIQRLHSVFGELYSALNASTSGLFLEGSDGDAQLMQLISCYLRMASDGKSLWQSGETAYAEYFRAKLLEKSEPEGLCLINTWLDSIKELADQLPSLEQYLSRDLGSEPSMHFPAHFSLSDDYRATLLSLGLQPHLLALLLRFRAIYACDWHQQFPMPASGNPQLATLILDLIADVRDRAQKIQGTPQALFDYLDILQRDNWYPRNKMSMLEVVERMQLFNWNLGARWYQNFVHWCRATILAGMTPENFVAKWGTWCSAVSFIQNVLTGYNDPNFKFLLKEYERNFGKNLHETPPASVTTPKQGLEWEHVFAQNIDGDQHFNTLGGFGIFGFRDEDDFVQNMLWRSGNLTWLSKSANVGLGNKTPDIKASDYQDCPGHPSGSGQNICSNIQIVKRLGEQMSALGTTYPAYRLQLEARCAELAIFALKRFGG